MAGKLTGYFGVRDRLGNVCSFGPDDDVPAWAAKQITNPSAWEGGSAPDSGGSDDGPPPRAGKGSGREAWEKYATDNGVEVDPEWSRDEIIDELDDRGITVDD